MRGASGKQNNFDNFGISRRQYKQRQGRGGGKEFHEYFIDSLRIRGRLFALTPVRGRCNQAQQLAVVAASVGGTGERVEVKSRFQIGIKFISNCVYNSIKTSGL